MAKTILITGGCRSGKSRHALTLAETMDGQKMYVATAEALDAEMTERIEKHRQERGPGWETHEEPIRLTSILKSLETVSGVLVLDCLTLWVSNWMLKADDPESLLKEADRLIDQCRKMQCTLIVVTNEVGAGIVPENKLARDFRDQVGSINQRFAQEFDEVVHMMSGIPVRIKL